MSLNDAAKAAVTKKEDAFSHDFGRFAVRAILAGAYLTLGTAFAGVAGQAVAEYAPALGPVVFALLFGLGLFTIVILGAELATGNMMYLCFGSSKRWLPWGKTFLILIATTLFNLVGAIIIASIMGTSAKFAHMTPDHLIAALAEGKLNKTPLQCVLEGIAANFVVNMGIVGAIFAKDLMSKFMVIVPVIAIFVGLGLEHVIANFSLMTLTFFGSNPLIESMTVGSTIMNWCLVWVGNVIGGGFLIGGVYAWLNSGRESYRD